MNKTVTINISGIVFHIEEQAYEALGRYLASLKSAFTGTEGGAEILNDIESRIAELLQQKLSESKQVITLDDVEEIKAVMGKPEDFGSGEPQPEAAPEGERIKRRLFRNTDDKVIGGVCSGLAAYFDIDIVWVRLAMFLLVFFGGLSIWVYIILWIVIPEPRSTADRLAMRGESANINTIMRNVREEANDVKTRLSKTGRDFQRSYGDRVRENVGGALGTVFQIVGRLVGLLLIFIGIGLLLAYVGALTGFFFVENNQGLNNWKHSIFRDGTDYTLAIFAFIVVVGIPVFMLLFGGLKLLLRLSYRNRWLNLSLGLIWVLGMVIGVYVTFSTLKQFSNSAKAREITTLHGLGDTIVVRFGSPSEKFRSWDFDNASELAEIVDDGPHHGFLFGENDHKLSVLGCAGLDVISSPNDSVEVIVSCSSQGGTKQEANRNAGNIQYNYTSHGNVIEFDPMFRTREGDPFRAQDVDVRLRLPQGKVIYFDRSAKYFLDDVDNTTNTWDGDMVGRRWKMTANGLECIDCDNLESPDGKRHNHKHYKKVQIDEHGVRIRDKDTKVTIDDDGIIVHTPDKDYEVK